MAQCISDLNRQHVDGKIMQNNGISLSKSSSDVSQLARFLTDGSRCSQMFPKKSRERSWFTLDVFLFFIKGRPRKSLGEDCPWCQRIKFTSKVLCPHFSYPDAQMVLEYLPTSKPPKWPSVVGQYSMGVWDRCLSMGGMAANRNGDTRNQLHQTYGESI